MVAEKRINTAQLFTLIFILGMSLKMLMLPVLLLKSGGRNAVAAMTVILLCELACLAVLLAALKLAPDKSFAELLRACMGRWAAKAVFLLFALFFFLKLVLLSGEVRIFFSENLFSEFSWCVYAIALFAFCVVVGKGTLRALARTAQFLFPLIVSATVLMFVLSGITDYARALPLMENGWRNFFPTTLRYAMWYGDYSALVIVFGSLKRTKTTTVLSVLSAVAASVVVLFFTVGLTASFADVADLMRFGQNITGLSHNALGNAMHGRFDLVLFCVWLCSAFIKAGVFTYAVVYFIRSTVPCQPGIPALGVGVALYAVTFVCASATALHIFMLRYCAVPALVFQFAVPALALAAACAERYKTKRKAADGQNGKPARIKEDERCDTQKKDSDL